MTVFDTSKQDPLIHLLGASSLGSTGYIEAQEAQGQRDVVNSTKIPTDGTKTDEQREALEALGFKLGEIDPNDPMFREAELPEGWSREGSDHAMWSYIVDERGFRRVSIFYKAAFYDRSAHLSINRDPETKAQADAYEEFNAYAPYDEGWYRGGRAPRDGENVVFLAHECELDEDGRKVVNPNYSYSSKDEDLYVRTGKTRRMVVAPDGTVLVKEETMIKA